jgi:hypothetical protein
MYQQGGPFLAMRGPFITAAGGSSSAVMSPAAVIDGTDIDITFTTQIDLLTSDEGSPGVVGFYWSIGEGVAATNWQDVAADESFNHAFSVPLATIGAVVGDVINIDPGYSLTSPYSTIVSGSDSGAYVTPVVYVVAVDDTTPTEGVQIAMDYDYVIGPPSQVLTYRWQSSDGPSTVGTLQTYTPDAGDVGFTLTARVTSTPPVGVAGFDDSAATSAVAASGNPIGLEGSADFMLMETGDFILVESGASADISAFPAASTLGGTEVIAGVQGGNSRKVSIDQIKTYVNS